MCGNFVKPTKRRPKDWVTRGYRGVSVPFFFKWRKRIGKVECDCELVEESYEPYYGFSWYHGQDCSLMRHVDAHPQLKNLWNVDTDWLIAQSE